MMAVAALCSARAKIILIFGEGQVAGSGAVGGGKACEDGGGVANHFALKMFCDFSSGKWHMMALNDCR